MNIRSRLKTIEGKIRKEVSTFCLCYGNNLKSEVIPITIDEWKRRAESGEETNIKLPDFCEQCRKPINKQSIETTFEQLQENIRQTRNQIMITMEKFSDI